MADDDFSFDFENSLEPPQAAQQGGAQIAPDLPPGAPIGQSLGNYKKNYRQTVCTYWLKGLCMKGDTCGFLHEFNPERMPVCRSLLKYGVCKEPDCPYKHSLTDIKECNMFKLGFCVYGPQCRYRHTRVSGPPPDPSTLEAAKPRDFRNINVVVNSVNTGIASSDRPGLTAGRGRGQGRHGGGGRGQMIANGHDNYNGPRQIADRPWEGFSMQGGPRRPQPPSQPPPGGPMQNGTGILAAVGQQGLPYGF